jgi:hypothetical protein
MTLEEFNELFPEKPERKKSTAGRSRGPGSKSHSNEKSNTLTREIIRFLQLKGHQAERISVTGRQIAQSYQYTDILGNRRTGKSYKFIKSSMQAGSADISATISGRSVKIEVKVGRDSQRDAQKRYQEQVEKAGGVYIIAKTLDDFMGWYENFMSS